MSVAGNGNMVQRLDCLYESNNHHELINPNDFMYTSTFAYLSRKFIA
jgi:hypothetical protein